MASHPLLRWDLDRRGANRTHHGRADLQIAVETLNQNPSILNWLPSENRTPERFSFGSPENEDQILVMTVVYVPIRSNAALCVHA